MLQVKFIMIYIIHKTSVSLKIAKTFKRFLRSITDFFFFIYFFSKHIMIKRLNIKKDKENIKKHN